MLHASAMAEAAVGPGSKALLDWTAILVAVIALAGALGGAWINAKVKTLETSVGKLGGKPRGDGFVEGQSRVDKLEATLLTHEKNLKKVIADEEALQKWVEEEKARRESPPSQTDPQQAAPEGSKVSPPKNETDPKKVIVDEAVLQRLVADGTALGSQMKQQQLALEELTDTLARHEAHFGKVTADGAGLPKLVLEVLKFVLTKDETGLKSQMKQQQLSLKKLRHMLAEDETTLGEVIADEAALRKQVEDEIAPKRKRGGNGRGGAPSTTPSEPSGGPPRTGSGMSRGERPPRGRRIRKSARLW